MQTIPFSRAAVGVMWLVLAALAQAAPIRPGSDEEIVERLPARLAQARGIPSADPAAAASQAQALIEQSRRQGDPRALGQAQTLLSPWWDKANAPADIAVLQATILQSQHEFAAARIVLQRVTASAPRHAQAWLTLATVERVTGNLAASDTACTALATAGARWYAALCSAENQSLRGGFATARIAYEALAATPAISTAQIAWTQSLAAENEERAGNDRAAQILYEQALQTQTDGYTALAFADLLLRTGQYARVGMALMTQPATDAVLIRRATAARRLQDPAWKILAQELFARRAQLALRDDSAAHARELALIALWLEDNPQEAWHQAQRNYALQREAFDAWLLVQAAQATGNPGHANTARQKIQAIGIVDTRIRTVRDS